MSTYTPIATQTLGSAATKVTFSSIPQDYTDVILVGVITNSTSTIYGAIQFNADTATSSTNYSVTSLANWQNNPYSDRQSNTYGIATWEKTVGSTDDTGTIVITVKDYSSTAKYKTAMARVGTTNVSSSGNNIGLWRSFDPVTSITFDAANGNNFGAGCTFTLYGVTAVNSSAKATGGNIVTTDGSYWYHAFTSSGSFVPSAALTADILVVAGGAGGGAGHGGGGGAGGVLAFSSQSLSASTTYFCKIGAGGAGGTPSQSQRGFNGNNSQFASLTETIGGGGGGSYNNAASATGGSGGGGGGGPSTISGSAGTSGQGNNGGTGTTNGTAGGGGGGGGKGGNGSDAAGNNGGQGGAGTNSVTNWGSLSSVLTSVGLGVSGYIAGGGGGGAWNATGGNGGSGGGGNGRGSGYEGGSYINAGFPATGNTGSGGGGGPDYNNGGGKGASGLIIVRYAV